MPTVKVAHIHERGIDLIIVPLESTFGRESPKDQDWAISELQMRSGAAGLSGAVVPVWDGGAGQMAFIAPQRWHAFLSKITLLDVWENVNTESSW